MKFGLSILFLLIVSVTCAQDSLRKEHPDNILALGSVEIIDTLKQGAYVNFAFETTFNPEPTLEVYDQNGILKNSVKIGVYSEVGIALTTRQFVPGTYYLCLKLLGQNMVKKIHVIKP